MLNRNRYCLGTRSLWGGADGYTLTIIVVGDRDALMFYKCSIEFLMLSMDFPWCPLISSWHPLVYCDIQFVFSWYPLFPYWFPLVFRCFLLIVYWSVTESAASMDVKLALGADGGISNWFCIDLIEKHESINSICRSPREAVREPQRYKGGALCCKDFF